MNDDRRLHITSEAQLSLECRDLRVARRVVVVVVETTFANRYGAGGDVTANCLDVPARVELCSVVRVNAGSVIHESWLRRGDGRRAICRGEGFPDRHDRDRTSITRARDGCIAINVERGIGEMRVTIDEAHTSEHRRESAAVLAER